MPRIGLFVKNESRARRKADELESWLIRQNVAVVRKGCAPPGRRMAENLSEAAPADLSCLFVLGGDGTILSAARWIGEHPVPLLGVKFGEVGFLAEAGEDLIFSAAEKILNGDFTATPRMRLTATVNRDGREIASEPVFNDVVINKGALARLARIKTYIDGRYLTTFRADGLIVSTPTGSTGYNLAAGGPVIHPSVPAFIITPICPFTLTNRPLILPDSAGIDIRLAPGFSDIMLTFDGQTGLEITEADTITVRKSDHPVWMINLPERDYFDILKTKLRWSGERI